MNAINQTARKQHIRVFSDLVQGSDEWLEARCGLLTASEMKLIVTPTLKTASNDKERTHLYELLGQRITKYVEPHYIGDDMLRGQFDEVEARIIYAKHFAPVDEVGLITNSKWGFTIGYSPDGLIGTDGAIECKSRRQKFQIETIAALAMPDDFLIQIQTGLLVSEREWIDFVSYCSGLPMVVLRNYAEPRIQNAILEAAASFEDRLQIRLQQYETALKSGARLIPTERKIEQEMYV